jgi:hypothetical protein
MEHNQLLNWLFWLDKTPRLGLATSDLHLELLVMILEDHLSLIPDLVLYV